MFCRLSNEMEIFHNFIFEMRPLIFYVHMKILSFWIVSKTISEQNQMNKYIYFPIR